MASPESPGSPEPPNPPKTPKTPKTPMDAPFTPRKTPRNPLIVPATPKTRLASMEIIDTLGKDLDMNWPPDQIAHCLQALSDFIIFQSRRHAIPVPFTILQPVEEAEQETTDSPGRRLSPQSKVDSIFMNTTNSNVAGQVDSDDDEDGTYKGPEGNDGGPDIPTGHTDDDDLSESTKVVVKKHKRNLRKAKKPAAKAPFLSPRDPYALISLKAFNNNFPSHPPVLSSDISALSFMEARRNFYEAIMAMDFQIRKSNKMEKKNLTSEEALSFTQIFFVDTFGASGCARFFKLVRQYSTTEAGVADAAAIRRSELAANNVNLPIKIRDVFAAFALAKTSSPSHANELASFWHLYRLVDLYNRFNELKQAFENGDQAVVNTAARAGFTTAKGTGVSTVIKRYLASAIDLDVLTFNNTIQSAVPLVLITEAFGPGVLCFLPSNVQNKLCRLNIQRLEPIFNEFLLHLPVARNICELVKDNVLLPMLTGTDIRLTGANTGRGPLYERIQTAAESNDAIMEEEGDLEDDEGGFEEEDEGASEKDEVDLKEGGEDHDMAD